MTYNNAKFMKKHFQGIYGFTKEAEDNFLADIDLYNQGLRHVEEMESDLDFNE